MLIFVQVCRTIDKISYMSLNQVLVLEEQMRAMKFTKGRLCCKIESEEDRV